jgi:hypothetical protein
MLSQVAGPSDENDRSREPLLGGLAGFAFTGLVLFTMYLSAGETAKAEAKSEATPKSEQWLPAPVLTSEERTKLLAAADELHVAADRLTTLNERLTQINDKLMLAALPEPAGQKSLRDSQDALLDEWLTLYGRAADRIKQASTAIRLRLTIVRDGKESDLRGDRQAKIVLHRANEVRYQAEAVSKQVEEDFINTRWLPSARTDDVRRLREDVLLLAGSGELPARNVANIGYLLYAHHLLAVELAGTLLLVASIGAVAIARRRGAAA